MLHQSCRRGLLWKHNHVLLVSEEISTVKTLSKSIHAFLNYHANTQTHMHTSRLRYLWTLVHHELVGEIYVMISR